MRFQSFEETLPVGRFATSLTRAPINFNRNRCVQRKLSSGRLLFGRRQTRLQRRQWQREEKVVTVPVDMLVGLGS
jgi:hypothetical protein